MNLSKTLLLCVCCLVNLGSSFNVIAQAPESDQNSQLVVNNQHSVLWKVTGKDLIKPSYVFGSWHLLCRNEIVFKNKVKLAISQTEQLLIQNFVTYLTSNDYFAQIAENESIHNDLQIYQLDNRKQRKKLLKLIDQKLDLKINHAKRTMPQVKRMTPMEVFLSSMHSFIQNCNGLGSFESLLFDHYQKNQFKLGSVNNRKTFLDSLMASGFVNPDSLIAYLENMDSQQALVQLMKKHYYLDENLIDLTDSYRIFLTNDFTDPKKIEQHILSVDVSPWVEVMSEWILQKPTFVSVNASYLMGEQGVITALRQRGFVVEPVF